MWDAVIIAGKHSLLDFQLFQTFQRTYSWMKYYNSELELVKKNEFDKKILKELLIEVKKSIEKALNQIHESNIYRKS
jgi:predicted DNA-binding protein YlxM (UPF0122 family)